MPRRKLRLGHAVRTEDDDDHAALRLALGIANATAALEQRAPKAASVVFEAERILNSDLDRPIYAYVGALHKDLGTVGLVISPRWGKRCIRSAIRCDSGCLIGGFGGFACVVDREDSLKALSYIGATLKQWQRDFDTEMTSSYRIAERDYVSGATPDYRTLKDVRGQCIKHVKSISGGLDRRLWTWEAWLDGSPRAGEIECIVLSPEMRKRLESLRIGGLKVPSGLRILSGKVTSSGIDWFNQPLVHAAFLGLRRWPK